MDERIDDSVDTSKVVPQMLTKRGMCHNNLDKDVKDEHDNINNFNENNPASNNLREEYALQYVANKMPDLPTNYEKISVNTNTNDAPYSDPSRVKMANLKYTDSLGNNLQRSSLESKNPQNNNNDESNYRGRRDAQNANKEGTEVSSSTRYEDDSNIKNDDEESTIKKHVKRLSEDELDDLLKSLSDSKRELLKRIMDSDLMNSADTLMKRDITKKAGAVEENNLNENEHIDSNKILSETSETPESISETTITEKINDKKDTNKQDMQDMQNENVDSTSSKNVDTSSNTASDTVINKMTPSESVTESDKIVSQIKEKREAYNVNEQQSYSSFGTSSNSDKNDVQKNDEDYFCPQVQEYSNLMDYEPQIQQNNEFIKKREAAFDSSDQKSDSLKSLEESFPNSNSYEDSAMNMAPLVRVKRKDILLKKRSAALVPDAKISYFPYRAENDDEDNDEGNEFDDDGFYDRTSNLAKNAEEKSALDNDVNTNSDKMKNSAQNVKSDKNPSSLYAAKDHSSDNVMVSLGSDTDNVLSGMEGVDDNLMFSSGSRSRRSSKCNTLGSIIPTTTSLEKKQDGSLQSLDNKINYPLYQENDAFGPLQTNYEENVGRYKRIRNVEKDSR